MTCQETVRKSIIQAAKERFLHYGYAKTTMAELACDCKMSSGNLYRYFQGKLDIAEEIARDASEETLKALREVVRTPSMGASDKLRAFLQKALEFTYHMLENDPRIYEMAATISAERPEFANDELAKHRALIVEILSAGNNSGEFNIQDVVFAAEMIQSATMKFKYPQLWSQLPLEGLRRELTGVLDLILRGVTCRGDATVPAA
jgi:AcrR family transcriptional regulator